MNLEELKCKLESTGLPVAYREWPEGESPGLPFIAYLCKDTNNLYADGEVYFTSDNVLVELYTETKSPEKENLVQTALKGYHWKKSETYISTERCYMTTYEIEV
ncbi:MAG: hypothetical protein IKA47_11475 [Oscillospiraceae bacterium]|nr:hypothetical protein [Oscillospiraceae bacterium]MBR2422017.1 hypothetical protein [Oscillospiraceae bacterium]